MKRFVFRLLLFCIVPMAVLVPLAYVTDAGLHKSRHFFFAEWNDLFDGKINADMLINGSSRAWVQFSPYMLDTGLGVNSYNLGMDAAPPDIQYERLKVYLRYNKKPKYILQEVSYVTVFFASRALPNYQQFLPYLNDTAIWRLYKNLYPNVTIVERYFPLYKYNNQLPIIKEGLLSYAGRGRVSGKYKGYMGQNLSWDSSFSEAVKSNPSGFVCKIEPKAVAIMEEYMTLCKENNIQMILVYPPFYYEANRYIVNHELILNKLDELAKKYEIPFLDCRKTYLDSSKAYYYNSQHLNKNGSELFTQMLVGELKKNVPDFRKTESGTIK
jgi:hypothetical protein